MSIQAILCEIPPSLLAADELLTEYGRWATTFSGRGGGEPTLERRFRRHLDRAESLAAFEARRTPANPLMPVQEALLCQRALSRVPDRERIVLSILYVRARWFSAHQELRILRIPPQLSRIRHEQGLRMFDNLHRVLAVQSRHKFSAIVHAATCVPSKTSPTLAPIPDTESAPADA